ncbi:MAG TPA: TolC family protein [Opitutaceae bacterium]|nr:TolC family protein [Opitutaceae bacterium]
MKLVRFFYVPVVSLALAASSFAAAPAAPLPVPDQLDLQTAIGFAVENNFAIRQARERIRQQEGIVLEVKARAIPNVAGSADYQINHREISNGFPPSHTAWAVTVAASQTVFAGGGVRSSVKSSRLAREAAELDLKGVINDALLSVRTAFFNVLLSREQIKVQESNLELLQQQLKTTTDRFEAGTVSSFERLRAEVAVANAKVPLITARNDYRLAIESLRHALGFTTDRASITKIPDFIGTLAYTPVNFDLVSSFQAAHINRPDLQRLEKLVAAREQLVTAARADYYPNVAVVAGWQLRKGSSTSFNDSNEGAFAGLQGQWAIFDGRATAGRVVQAKSLQEQSRLALSEAQLAAEVEVRRAFSSWQQATELADASQKVVAQAEEAVRLANARYSAGTSTQLDVLQVQVELTTARTNQIQAYYSYNVAVAALRRATGLADEFVTH